MASYRFELDSHGNVVIVGKLNGDVLDYKKPRRWNQKQYTDFTETEKQDIYNWMKDFKISFWKATRVIHFDDAYFLADVHIGAHPMIISVLRKRFPYVFVDEMQDMDVHQVKVMDRLFFEASDQTRTFQRIGDKNQAIFAYEIKLDDIWEDRPKVLTLSKSMRLSKTIAKIVEPFATRPILVEGCNADANSAGVQPRIIVYNDETIAQVIPRFAQTIKSLQETGKIPKDSNCDFKAIGWRRFADEKRKTIVASYYPEFIGYRRASTIERECFEDYLLAVDPQSLSSKVFSDSVSQAILKILSIEHISDTGAPFSKTRLIAHIKAHDKEFQPEFRLALYRMNEAFVKGDLASTKSLLAGLAQRLVLSLTGRTTVSWQSTDFITQKTTFLLGTENCRDADNVVEHDGVKIYVGTVHSTKGETHVATLYMETFFYSDGGKSFESQRLIDQLTGTQLPGDAGSRTKQSARVVYVGFSRPTHLLCLAVHRDRIQGQERPLEQNGWILDKTLIEAGAIRPS